MGGVDLEDHKNKRELFGIIGHPVKYSLSPAMHNAAFKALGINAEYKLMDISPDDPEELANFCYETDLNHIGGFSVTMPYKNQIMEYCDHYDPLAKMVSSVNTVNVEDSQLIGYNTDAMGAAAALQEKTEIKDKKVLLLGAGGAAKAIAYALREFNAEVFIYNRTLEKAEALAEELKLETIDLDAIGGADFDIIVNATSVGMKPNIEETILRSEQIPQHAVVMDIITSPLKTQLLKEAEEAGAEIVTGERMLLHQAAGQFEIWFKQDAPIQVMEGALYAELEKRVD